MKSSVFTVITVLLLSLGTRTYAQGAYSDSDMRQTAATRIEKNYNIKLDSLTYSLTQLLDIEARIESTARIKRNFHIGYDYRAHTLSEFLDIEARLSSAERIKRTCGVNYDWRTTSLSQLLAAEASLLQKSRVSQPPSAPRAQSNATPRATAPPVASAPELSGRRLRAMADYDGVEEYIDNVSSSGAVITLSDGSIWKVSPFDRIDTALWLPVTDVRIIAGDDPSYPYKMINKDDGEVANVMPLSP